MKGSTAVAANLALALLLAAPPGARADDKGDAVLRQAFATLHAARTYSADFSSASKMGDQAGPALKGKMRAMKPNYLQLVLEGTRSTTIVSDGTSLFSYTGGTPYFFKQAVPPKPTELPGSWEGEIDSFFGGAANVAKVETTYVGAEMVGGVPCAIVKAQMHEPDRTATYAVGKADHLIHRMMLNQPGPNGATLTMTNTLSNIRLNVSLTAAEFAFTPPKTAKLYEPPDYNAKLVKVGLDAPNFTLPTPSGGQVILESTLRGKKAVMVNFWFYG
jgi:outer membrane lipoprotein-sorting protein